MADPDPDKAYDVDPFVVPFWIQSDRWRRRHEKIVQEILANRRGEYRVPTWVLALCLAGMIALVTAFVLLAG